MSRGVISFVFDDGYESVYRAVVPALEEHGFKGVFALPLAHETMANQSKQLVRPWPRWLGVQSRGHELAAHSATHRDLTTLASDELDHELRSSHQAWGATTIVYPGGAYNEAVVENAATYFSAGRTVERGLEPLHPSAMLALRTFNFTKRNFSLWKANLIALWAWLTNSWLIETYHLVDDAKTDIMHTVPLQDFRRHLQFVSRLPLTNKTIHEAVRDCHN
jgi:peptidoglycan/xylan/chitin deacetylase (PgdA/CDA1 family)